MRVVLRAFHLVLLLAGVLVLVALAFTSPGAVVYLAVVAVVLGLIVFAIVRATRAFAPSKTCPACAERVRREATLCRFCGHRFVA